MRADYQVLAFRDAAPLRQVGFFSQSPLTLDIRGQDFVGVSAVLINDTLAPEFVVVSPRRILAEVPASQRRARLTALRVLLDRAGLTETSAIELQAVVPGARATGFTKLLQAFLRVLFTNPGEDIAYPWMGGGLYSMVGMAGSQTELRTGASTAISTAEQHLIRLQVRNPVLTDAERLRSATLLSSEYNKTSTSVDLRVTLTAADGTTGNPLVRV